MPFLHKKPLSPTAAPRKIIETTYQRKEATWSDLFSLVGAAGLEPATNRL